MTATYEITYTEAITLAKVAVPGKNPVAVLHELETHAGGLQGLPIGTPDAPAGTLVCTLGHFAVTGEGAEVTGFDLANAAAKADPDDPAKGGALLKAWGAAAKVPGFAGPTPGWVEPNPQVVAKALVMAFAEFYPTPNVGKMVAAAEAGLITWLDAEKLAVQALEAGLAAAAEVDADPVAEHYVAETGPQW